MSQHHVVIQDPNGTYWPGALIEGERLVNVLKQQGVVMLPCEPNLFMRSGIGGFFKREWGAGIPLSNQQPKMLAPMTMFVDREFDELHWAVRLTKDHELAHIEQFNGILRLAHDNGQPGAHVAGLGPSKRVIAVNDLGAADEHGGWTVYGSNSIQPNADGYMGLSFYGSAPGLRLVWTALSLSRGQQ